MRELNGRFVLMSFEREHNRLCSQNPLANHNRMYPHAGKMVFGGTLLVEFTKGQPREKGDGSTCFKCDAVPFVQRRPRQRRSLSLSAADAVNRATGRAIAEAAAAAVVRTAHRHHSLSPFLASVHVLARP